ncbi:MAG: hypothetical protein U7123_15905 [Potamolinea sp.]
MQFTLTSFYDGINALYRLAIAVKRLIRPPQITRQSLEQLLGNAISCTSSLIHQNFALYHTRELEQPQLVGAKWYVE